MAYIGAGTTEQVNLPKLNIFKVEGAQSNRLRSGILPNNYKEDNAIRFYTTKPTWYAYLDEDEETAPRPRHATISVIKHRARELSHIDNYLSDCEQRFKVEYLKRMSKPAEQTWRDILESTNAQLNPRGKNTVLECLQFGGNREF